MKETVRNIRHHSGLKEQNWLLVSDKKHDVTTILDIMAYIMAKASRVPALGLCSLVTLVFLRGSGCRENRVVQASAPTSWKGNWFLVLLKFFCLQITH